MKNDPATYDPHVKALGGFDVTALSVVELRERGVKVSGPVVAVHAGAHPAWITHSEYLGQNPSHDEVDRAYARAASHVFLRRTGSLEGLSLARTFPCLGMLRVLQNGEVLEVQCDACGDAFGVRRPQERKPRRKVPSGEFEAGF